MIRSTDISSSNIRVASDGTPLMCLHCTDVLAELKVSEFEPYFLLCLCIDEGGYPVRFRFGFANPFE